MKFPRKKTRLQPAAVTASAGSKTVMPAYRATRWAGTVVPALGGARSPPGGVAHIMSRLPQQSVSASLARSRVGRPGLRNRCGVGQELVL
jgi:hypothetical protein